VQISNMQTDREKGRHKVVNGPRF